ncbi:MAG: hydroxymethylglutaryl-CoA synthase family protein [Bradymonadia bacterium]
MTLYAPPPATGIASIGLKLPGRALSVEALAELRGVDPAKYRKGLDLDTIALCAPGEGVADLATGAARRALERWGGDLADIGLIAVGTESAIDMSRPLSAWVADDLGVSGQVRSYEVKHACYGGTLALLQAMEWRRSGNARGKAALVIAADVARYAPASPGEPTQGAGAVAMVVGAPRVASVSPLTWAYSEPAFDFWRPVGEAYPHVDGKFSLECYNRAAVRCFEAMGIEAHVDARNLARASFHVPFPKMVKKAVWAVAEAQGWSEADRETFWHERVAPGLTWNRLTGNAYTAGLWISVACALRGLAEGAPMTAFSYGSGFGAELMQLTAGSEAAAGEWGADIEADVSARELISAEQYVAEYCDEV